MHGDSSFHRPESHRGVHVIGDGDGDACRFFCSLSSISRKSRYCFGGGKPGRDLLDVLCVHVAQRVDILAAGTGDVAAALHTAHADAARCSSCRWRYLTSSAQDVSRHDGESRHCGRADQAIASGKPFSRSPAWFHRHSLPAKSKSEKSRFKIQQRVSSARNRPGSCCRHPALIAAQGCN